MSRKLVRRVVLAGVALTAACSAAAAAAQERFVLSENRVCQSFGGLAVNLRMKQLALWMCAADAEGQPDGRHIAVFDLETRRLVKTLPPPVGVQLSSLAFAPDGSALASNEKGSALRVWETEKWNERILWEAERAGGEEARLTTDHRGLVYSPSGDAIAIVAGRARDEIAILDARSGELRSTFKPAGLINNIAFARGESCLAAATTDRKRRAAGPRGKVEFWDIRSERRICTLSDGTGPSLIEMSPERDVMATLGSLDQRNPASLRLWRLSEIPAKSDFSHFQEIAQGALCAAFSPSGAVLAVGHSPPTRRVTVYSVATGAVRFTFDHPGGQSIANMAFAGEDELITAIHRLAGEKAPTVLLWKLP